MIFKTHFVGLYFSDYGVKKSGKVIAKSGIDRGLYFTLKLEN